MIHSAPNPCPHCGRSDRFKQPKERELKPHEVIAGAMGALAACLAMLQSDFDAQAKRVEEIEQELNEMRGHSKERL